MEYERLLCEICSNVCVCVLCVCVREPGTRYFHSLKPEFARLAERERERELVIHDFQLWTQPWHNYTPSPYTNYPHLSSNTYTITHPICWKTLIRHRQLRLH
mgnify:CR=1 FL=1